MSAKRLGVIGAGVIGSGVAHLFAQEGLEVTLVDIAEAQLDTARQSIRANTRAYALLSRERHDPDEILGRMIFTTDLAALCDVDFIIENIVEDWPAKQALHGQLADIARPEVVIAANTSAIPITRIAGAGRAPERYVGMHFMNPPPVMPMVEIIRAVHSTEAAIDAARDLVKQARRNSIVVGDSPGFVTNRVMMLAVNEAMFLVHEGVSTAQDVDRLFKTCFGHKMGLLETADLIGLDTVLRSLEVLYDEFNDDKYRPCPLLKRLVYAGHCGRKNGKGFHDYAH